ncbi:MAG: lipoyl(octanoyl) transferase LipB [Bacteroidetes bacterium]|nr:lipoyl(octanoyl) transferase LipB [Bacteroidota bacterium]
MNQLLVIDLGRTRYADTWELQKRIFAARLERRIGDVLLLTEHEPVFTLGKGADENHLLATDAELSEKKIDMFWIDRGGDVTFHGPGQIVGYPIIDLNLHYNDIHRYLRDIEEMIIRTLKEYGVEGGREKEFTGVWVKNEKIAALGVKVSKWITMHGFALNVQTDLSFFDRIIPCGIFHKGVTSLHNVLGRPVPITEVHVHLIRHFADIFSLQVKQISVEELLSLLHHHEAAVEEK